MKIMEEESISYNSSKKAVVTSYVLNMFYVDKKSTI